MRDTAIYPEHEDGEGETCQARGIEAPNPSPDSVAYEDDAE